MITISIPTLETERLTLRAPQADDFDNLAAFMASDRAAFIGGPVSGQRDVWRILSNLAGHWLLRGFGMWAIVPRDETAAIGVTGGWQPKTWPEREIGWSLWSVEAEGKGYAYEAATAARAHLYARMGWTTAVSYIDRGNSRSIALAERLGCTLDQTAERPQDDDPTPCLVYRHPAPEALH